MKDKTIAATLATTLLLVSSCASIVSRSSYPVTINSTPSSAKITIINKKGIETYNGNTPAKVTLEAASGFFSKERYTVKFEKEGYDERIVPIECQIDGWYWGNFVFGGFLGFIIIDPLSGAMFKLKTPFINEVLTTSTSDNINQRELKIYSIDEIPEHWKTQLVRLEK